MFRTITLSESFILYRLHRGGRSFIPQNNTIMSGNIPITGAFSRMELLPDAASPPVTSSFDLKLARMSSSSSFGTSPPDTFKMPPRTRRPTRSETFKQLKPFASADIKICTLPSIEKSTANSSAFGECRSNWCGDPDKGRISGEKLPFHQISHLTVRLSSTKLPCRRTN